MRECPELSTLEQGVDDAVRAHLADCSSCRVVVELLAERRRGLVERDRREQCARFELLLAARNEGTIGDAAGELLDAHLRECADCKIVAATLPPADERRQYSALPAVSTAAYALGKEVARGGMGRILEAQDVRIGRAVAVKELLGKGRALAARFEREARVTARLQHPGVVPIYEIGKWPDGTPFYAMRMVEGRTLREAIQGKRGLDERLSLLPAVISAADAVAFAHGKRIIHRDLTPNNVLVGEYGDTVVIDWGLAKDLSAAAERDDDAMGPYRDEPADANLTSAGAIIGTAAYMPPEQASGASVDERADVYALGAILYHVLSGEPPYRASKSEDIVRRVQQGPPLPIAEVAAGAPRDLISIVEKAMARDPAERYASARELVEELRRFQTGRVVQAHEYTLGERARRWLRAHRALVLASAAASMTLAVAGTIGVASVLRERDRAETAATKAETENALLMEEQGRQELIAGNPMRAAVWLNEAYKAGDERPELRFLLGTAMKRVESVVHTGDCGGKVQSIEFSPDGKHVLAACQFGMGIARTSDWQVEYEIQSHADGATYSHDGALIASWDYKRLTIWDAATGALRLGPIDIGERGRTVHFTPDDRTLVTTTDDAMVRTWDVATGRMLHEMNARSGTMNVVRADLTPDGKTIVSMTSDGVYQAWDTASGAHVSTFKIPVQPLAADHGMISPDGTSVLSCGADGSVWITELATGRTRSTFPAHANIAFECVFTRDGKTLLTAGMDGTAKLWDVATSRLLTTLHHGGLWLRAELSPDGQRVATLGSNGVLKVWHTATGALLATLDDPFGDFEKPVFSPDGHALLCSRQPSRIVVIQNLDAEIRPIALPPGSSAEGASPDLSRLVVSAKDGSLRLLDPETLVAVPSEPLRAPFAFSRDASRMAAIAADGVVVLDVKTGATVAHLKMEPPEMLALDDRGRRLLAAGNRSAIWSVDTAAIELPLGKRSDKDCLSPDGSVVLAWQDPHVVEVWNVAARRVQATIRLTHETLGPVGFDHAGQHVILTEKEDPLGASAALVLVNLGLYAVASGAKQGDLGRSVFSVLDSDRRQLVTSALDGRLVISDASTGKRLTEIAGGSTTLIAGQTVAGGMLLAAGDVETYSIRSASDGRLLASMRSTINFAITQDSFNAGSSDSVIRSDGTALVLLGRHPVLWTLPREQRSPEVIDRIVRERVRWRVANGNLVPVTGTIKGRVLRYGKPVPGAEIAIERSSGWLHAVADAGGRFAVPSLAYGHYGVIVFSPDHAAKGMHDATLEREELSADYVLDEEATIAGQVVDERGQPVAGVEIKAGPGELSATSDAQGGFTIRALGVMAYRLFALQMKDGRSTGFSSVGQSVPVEITSNTQHVTGIRMVVRRANAASP